MQFSFNQELEKATAGDMEAAAKVGYCYTAAIGTVQNFDEGFKWIKIASDTGIVFATFWLGYYYFEGVGGATKSYPDAFRCFHKGAEYSMPEAEYMLGKCYQLGYGVDERPDLAVEHFMKATKMECSIAEFELGMCYLNGNGTTKNLNEALHCLRQAIEHGCMEAKDFLDDPDILDEIGDAFFYGKGVTRSHSEAFKFFMEAAAKGSTYAQYSLGWCYYHGKGVGKDIEKALYWYKKAGAGGDSNAREFLDDPDNFNAIGYTYETGDGVLQSDSRAASFYEEAANKGSTIGQYNLAGCYYHGMGVGKDFDKALYWYRKAAAGGDSDAKEFLNDPDNLSNIGYAYKTGDGVSQSNSRAASFYEEAANKGSTIGQYNLAGCYYHGMGVGKDFDKALYWYRKAAAGGDSDAKEFLNDPDNLSNIGYAYKTGDGVSQSNSRAVSFYEEAANKDSAIGQYNLAGCYYHGMGVGKDFDKALYWYRKAAAGGDSDAKEFLDDPDNLSNIGYAYEIGDGVSQSNSRAASFYEEAADKGSAIGQYNLAGCYYHGKGVPENNDRALYWCERAVSSGYYEARQFLQEIKEYLSDN